MFYVVVKENKYMLNSHEVSTEEKAKILEHCMSGFWRYKIIGIFNSLDEIREKFPEMMNTIYNQSENFYCTERAIKWKKGMPRCA